MHFQVHVKILLLAKLLPFLAIHEKSCPPSLHFFFIASAVVHAKLNRRHDRGMQMNFFFTSA